MIRKVLVADRGVPAVRILRACRSAGLRTVAVYADQDWDALHVRVADEAYAVPGTSARGTYGNIDAVLTAARRAGADAIHPGCAELGESAAAAEAVLRAGLSWIGSGSDALRRLGDPVAARAVAVEAGVPVLPGTLGPVASVEDALAYAEAHGLPLVVRPVHVGGALRIVRIGESVREAYTEVVREAMLAVGNGDCVIERWIDDARHIAVDVAADPHDSVVVIGTRDRSVQRRQEELVDEAPAPYLSPEQTGILERSAVAIVRTAGCVGVGTVEFLLAPSGDLFFRGVRPNLVPGHSLTEDATGIDLVREQLRVADGLPLSLTGRPQPHGSALGFRISAEDPGRGFLPSPGRISSLAIPGGAGVRVDTGVESGSIVSEALDPLIAHAIVSGRDRREALARARRALAELSVTGVATTLPLHRSLLRDPAFTGDECRGVHAGWLDSGRREPDEPQEEFSDIDVRPVLESYAIEVQGRRTSVRIGGLRPAAPGSAERGDRLGDRRGP
ncbi:biotin carboxylase N-terminal domain-containing protein [Naasia sp. SYSU D00948]|uniref:ATP-binding protein n=1 Tax=Naasia sp. SYSU D00948 TaxID=2817379 RepID=UPI001B31532E|nr:biotin carboxylase N-terminal domain-containing protein [Naasia sp. SYSU D00948]